MGVYEEAIATLEATLARAKDSGRRNMNAMTLATVNGDARPSTRTVLLKDIDDSGLVFFTDERSRKGQDMAVSPYASACFYWEPIEAQARIDGVIERLPPEHAQRDFAARPRAGQLMIWASAQSQSLVSKSALVEAVEAAGRRYSDEVPVPAFWHGYRLVPDYIELWFGSRDRMHERVAYTHAADGWQRTLLQP